MEKKTESNTVASGLLKFDPIVLVQDVLRRWLVVLLAVVAVAVGSYIYLDNSYVPSYRTNVVFVVTTRGSSTTVYNNLSSTSNLANLFTELLNSSIMRRTIMEEMGVSYLNASVSTSVIPNTNLVNMTVTSSDPRTAFLTAKAIIDHHESLTYTVVDGILMEVLQYPTVPVMPSNSSNYSGQIRKLALLAGIAAAAMLAFMSYSRDAVRSETEAREKLDCEFLGEISHEKKYKTLLSAVSSRKTSILIDNPVTSFRYVETIRKLRRRVEQHMHDGKVVMVTSLLENEGKSTVAVNLAMAMAKKYKNILLIDCDLRKPACHAILEHKTFGNGVREVLLGTAAPEDALVQYKGSHMYMMLARKGEETVGDLVGSENMQQLLDWARERFDYVVLDLPPMGAASDAESMTALADACVLVVRQNVAHAPALNKAISALEGQRAKLLGCVMNNVYSTGLSSGSGYGYGYGYGRKYGYGYGRYKGYGHYGNYNKKK